MLITLLAWTYITFLCWSWGILFLHIAGMHRTDLQLPHFSIICITGLSVITIVAGILSLVIPLGDWWVQFLFIAPCIILFFKKNIPTFFVALKRELSPLHPALIILLSVCLLLILVMSSWKIIHPDTLGYHAQTIQWIEKYKAVPGLVHLHTRLGYQGLWFVDSALFNFSFTGKEGITFLNSTFLFWFFIFIINKIDHNFFKQGKAIYSLLWISLLSLSMWSYTQVRLTATSASPDFIATLFVLAIIHLLFQKQSFDNWFLAAFLSFVATTIKLSVAPILLIVPIALVIFIKARKIKQLFVVLIISVIVFFPFITRNIISSGYLIFPSTEIDVANVDWKFNAELTVHEKNYITAFAKNPAVSTREEIDSVNKMSIAEWIPGWWENRSLADKSIILLLVLSVFAALITIKKILQMEFSLRLVFLTLVAGIIFWFTNAPDPRFGFGFIIGFIAVVAYLVLKEKEISLGKNSTVILLLICSGVVVAYTAYRFKNFFSTDQLITPIGIEKTEYRTFDCEGLKINSPINSDFGTIPIPCTDLDCQKFSPRGNGIIRGFNAK